MIQIIKMISWIFLAICWWKVFEKADIKGWKAIIPFYGDYTKFKLGDKSLLYIPYLILVLIEAVVSFIYSALWALDLIDINNQLDMGVDLGVLNMVRWIMMIALLVIDFLVGMKIAVKFGKNKWFGIGLGVIPIVFVPILVFGKSTCVSKMERI